MLHFICRIYVHYASMGCPVSQLYLGIIGYWFSSVELFTVDACFVVSLFKLVLILVLALCNYLLNLINDFAFDLRLTMQYDDVVAIKVWMQSY